MEEAQPLIKQTVPPIIADGERFSRFILAAAGPVWKIPHILSNPSTSQPQNQQVVATKIIRSILNMWYSFIGSTTNLMGKALICHERTK